MYILFLRILSDNWWLSLLQNANDTALDSVAKFLEILISKEIIDYRRGVYYIAENKKEPQNYNYLPKHSLVRALIDYIKRRVSDFIIIKEM